MTHAGNLAEGVCQRCGNYLCCVCRSRWRGRWVCMGCIERALEARETHPDEVRAHFRQAILALLFGVGAWVITAGAILVAGIGVFLGQPNPALMAVAGMLILFSPLPGLLGVGQGAAAIRARGQHMIMATCGLLLAASQVGVVIGIMVLTAWNR